MFGLTLPRRDSSASEAGSLGSDGGSSQGYGHDSQLQQDRAELCTRCRGKVYQAEKVDIGIVLHRNCFRCLQCNVTLSINTFIISRQCEGGEKEVFCKAHAPKPHLHAMDPESMDIRAAVRAQKINSRDSFNHQIRLKTTPGWEYDPKAIDFEHAKELHERNRPRKPATHEKMADDLEYEQGELIRRLRQGELARNKVKDVATSLTASEQSVKEKSPMSSDYMEPNALWSPHTVQDPGKPSFLWNAHPQSRDPHGNRTPGSGAGAQGESVYETLQKATRGHRDGPDAAKLSTTVANSYCQETLSEDCARKGLRPLDQAGPQTKTYMREEAFIAQNKLELKQRHEHGELFRELDKARDEQIWQLEGDIKQRMKKAVQNLFFQIDSGSFQGDLDVEKVKIEQQFQRLREENMRHLLARVNEQERMRVGNMIDRQTEEMLHLIDKKIPAKFPAPCPPKTRKSQLYVGPGVFDDIDFHAVQVAQHEQDSFTELVYELTKNAKSQLEKARAIFRWLTVKDLNKILFRQKLSEDNPYYALQGIKYGLDSYHEVFKRLCSYAGLPVRIIRGVSKSAGYKPGMSFEEGSFRNSWAVIYIDNNWRFVDCHWGARHVTQHRDTSNPSSFCYAVDEFYFLTDPTDMIFMHFPDEKQWQLLQHPISMDEFINRPVLKSHFFLYGLQLAHRLRSVITTDTGKAEVVIRQTVKSLPLAFNTRLECDDRVLEGHCIHHSDKNDVIFDLVLPKRGLFYFSVFACDKDKSDAYSLICCFRAKCTNVENKLFCKFPKLPDGYGPTPLAAELGLTAEKFSQHYIVSKEDKMIMNLKFGCSVRTSQKLSCSNEDLPAEALERAVFLRYRDKSFVSYVLRFPERGIYVFSIFAARRDANSSVLECACRYVVQCNAKCSGPARSYPKTQQHWQRARLHEPTSGDLKVNKNVKFKLEVQGADAVAVIVGQQWCYLRADESGRLWEGMVHTGKEVKGKIDVYARHKGSERDFFPLLEYKLVAE